MSESSSVTADRSRLLLEHLGQAMRKDAAAHRHEAQTIKRTRPKATRPAAQCEDVLAQVHEYFADQLVAALAVPPPQLEEPVTQDFGPCVYPVGLTTCGYPRDACMHIGSAKPPPIVGQHAYQFLAIPPTTEELPRAVPPPPLKEPQPEWRCFHCDEVFTTHGSAADHFGATQGCDAGCLIDRVALEEGGKPERGRGLLMALRKEEAANAQLRLDNEHLENDSRLWHEAEADRVRRIGHVQWWQELDSREGEKLVLQERVKELEASRAVPPPQEEPMTEQNDAIDRELADACAAVLDPTPVDDETAGANFRRIRDLAAQRVSEHGAGD